MVTVIKTAIICITVVAIVWIISKDTDKKEEKVGKSYKRQGISI